MDLNLFFDSIRLDTTAFPQTSFFASVYAHTDMMPSIEGMHLALIGLRESRGGSQPSEGYAQGADGVRRQLYALKKGQGTFKVVDLGNFRNGPTAEDTILRLREVCHHLLSNQVVPILIGGTHDLDLGQYFAYEPENRLLNVLGVDNTFDFDDDGSPSQSHLARMFRHDPNYLFGYTHLGHQSYLIHHKQADLMERMNFEAIRLGVVKENVKEMEPCVRDADMISWDMSALQAQYAPGATDSKVYGLTGEEACQLCWYAGMNDRLTSIGFYEYDADKDSPDHKTAFVMATMIWYFIEGFYNRKGDRNFMSDDFLIYEVPLGGQPESIRFYKSKRSEKWWMEVPNPEAQGVFNRNRMIASSYADYQTALNGEVPDRWINFYKKA
jgi:formiminoglutamase